MKDGIVLHPEHGLNPSIELCIVYRIMRDAKVGKRKRLDH